MWKLSRRKQWIWQQKSRVKWTQEGDKNTRYFHVMANKRQSQNLLDSIIVNGSCLTEPDMVRQAVFRHFKGVYSKNWSNRPKLSGQFKSVANRDEMQELEAAFTEEEIWSALKECDGNKAPGPDGFNLSCIQKCWKLMKGEIVQLMHDFHSNGKLVKGFNSSFITLIPKKDNPNGLGDYRPISLVNSTYKILAKVLARRLKKVLPRVVGEVQSAFLGGRFIMDGVLIANEIIDWWKVNKLKGIILKLDFEKAYDSVNWGFLFSLLANFGFGDKWINWLKCCVTSARISVLVNGSPTDEFSPQRGLRQGDPLSPFLFNIIAEGLNLLLERAKEIGLFKGGQGWNK